MAEKNRLPVTVRRAEERDIDALLKLLVQVNLVHHKGRPDLFRAATKYGADDLKALLRDETCPVFVAVDAEGRVLGHGFCRIEQHVGDRLLTDVKTLYVDDICVDENAHGRGVGRSVYEAITAYARAIGCYNVTLNVWALNPGALAFYQKLGLVPYKYGMEQILREAPQSGPAAS